MRDTAKTKKEREREKRTRKKRWKMDGKIYDREI